MRRSPQGGRYSGAGVRSGIALFTQSLDQRSLGSLLRLTSWALRPGTPRGVEDEEGPWRRHCSLPPSSPWWDLWLGWLCVVLPQIYWLPLPGGFARARLAFAL